MWSRVENSKMYVLVYNQACLVWQVCLFILVITSKRNLCVCVYCLPLSLSLSVCRCQWRNWYSLGTCWHHKFECLGQLFHEWRQRFRFWGILSHYLTSTYTVSIWLRKELQGQKLTLTYIRVYTVHNYLLYYNLSRCKPLQIRSCKIKRLSTFGRNICMIAEYGNCQQWSSYIHDLRRIKWQYMILNETVQQL